jgi:hypothetical protein
MNHAIEPSQAAAGFSEMVGHESKNKTLKARLNPETRLGACISSHLWHKIGRAHV